jgi:hypothetical protein
MVIPHLSLFVKVSPLLVFCFPLWCIFPCLFHSVFLCNMSFACFAIFLSFPPFSCAIWVSPVLLFSCLFRSVFLCNVRSFVCECPSQHSNLVLPNTSLGKRIKSRSTFSVAGQGAHVWWIWSVDGDDDDDDVSYNEDDVLARYVTEELKCAPHFVFRKWDAHEISPSLVEQTNLLPKTCQKLSALHAKMIQCVLCY